MAKPKVFIGSSRKNIRLAEAVQRNFARTEEIEAIVWDQDIYTLGENGLTNLLAQLGQADFGVFIFAEDDEAIVKGKPVKITRDNVIFECGMYIGRLGPGRVFAITPPRGDTTHILSDFDGVMLASLQESSDNKTGTMVGPACGLIKDQIQALGRKGELDHRISRAERYSELLKLDDPELFVEKLVRTDELLQNGDIVIKEYFVGVRAYRDVQISEVSGSIVSQSGRPSAAETVSETEGYSVGFAWEDINSSGPFYALKTTFTPPLTKADNISFRRHRVLKNGVFWSQRDRLEVTGQRSDKENISQRIRHAFDVLDLRVVFPPKRFPAKFSVSAKNPQGDRDPDETIVAQRSFSCVEESRTVLLRVEKPLLHHMYIVEWDLPEEETTVPHLEPKYSGFVEEVTRRLTSTPHRSARGNDLQKALGHLRTSMELIAPDSEIEKSELTLFLYDRSRGGLTCVSTTDTEIDTGAVERYLFRPGRGVPGRAYRTMEIVVYANILELRLQSEVYEAIPPGTAKPQKIVIGFPVFHHSSTFRCIGVVTLSSHRETRSLLSVAQDPESQRALRNCAESWYRSVLAEYGAISSEMFWKSSDT